MQFRATLQPMPSLQLSLPTAYTSTSGGMAAATMAIPSLTAGYYFSLTKSQAR